MCRCRTSMEHYRVKNYLHKWSDQYDSWHHHEETCKWCAYPSSKKERFQIVFFRSFRFRWLNIKGIDVAFPVSIMLFSNHLKWNRGFNRGYFFWICIKCWQCQQHWQRASDNADNASDRIRNEQIEMACFLYTRSVKSGKVSIFTWLE